MSLTPQLVNKTEISEGVLKQTHDEFYSQNPADSIIDTPDVDDFALHQFGQSINEFGMVIGNHYLTMKTNTRGENQDAENKST